MIRKKKLFSYHLKTIYNLKRYGLFFFKNIFLHGSIYGYKSGLATPATATGVISFDYTMTPSVSSNVVKQEVVFGLREPMTKINVSDVIFSSSTLYTFVKDGDAYRTVISNSDGTVQTLPSNSSILEVPLTNFKQEDPQIIDLVLPNYSYGSYYTYTFEAVDEFVSGIRVFVKMPEETEYTEYDVEKVKYLIDPSAKAVFFNQTASDTYTIEFGNGVHGAWISGAEVRLLIHKTIGVAANFSQEAIAKVLAPTQLFLYNKMTDGSIQTTTLDPNVYLRVNFKHSEGGIDPLAGEELRRALVRFIRSRDNFISEDDFYDIIEKYTTDFRFLFKKMLVQENVFYLQRALRDEYMVPIRSMNLMPEIFTKEQVVDGIRYFTQDIGKLTPGLYFYKILAVDRFNNTIESDEIKTTLTTSSKGGSIHLEWKPIIGAIKYKIYGRTQDYERVWETTDTYFSDMGGTSDGSERTLGGIPEKIENPYSLFPEFVCGGKNFVSPFLYRFNPLYNYYEGFLFYPELLVNFASLEQTNQGEISAATIPSIFINIIYDQKTETSLISVKSYQQIYEWNFTLTIPELGIQDVIMDMVDESTATYKYTENQGFITGNFVITVKGTTQGVDVFVGKTDRINQRYDLTDLLQIPMFYHSGKRYLVDVPVLSSDVFMGNKTYYLDKILQFLMGLK